MVTLRGKTEREWGEELPGQKRVGGDPCSYRRGQTAPGAPPTEAAHQGAAAQGHPGSGSGADSAWLALEGPEVQIVTLATVCAEEIFTAHSGHSTNCLQNSKAGLCVI